MSAILNKTLSLFSRYCCSIHKVLSSDQELLFNVNLRKSLSFDKKLIVRFPFFIVSGTDFIASSKDSKVALSLEQS